MLPEPGGGCIVLGWFAEIGEMRFEGPPEVMGDC